MSIKLGIRVDLSQLKRMAAKHKAAVPKAIGRALNKTVDKTATAAAREISAATKIPVREVRKRLIVRRASSTHLLASIEALAYSPNLKKFRPTQNKRGVAATAWEGRKTYKGAFVNPKTGSVVTRTTDKRFPLKGLRGPSVRSTFVQDRIIAKLNAVAEQSWRTNIDHELARELKKALA
ncbi:MAG TPA: phage tail protein [Steroidobacteraceae bacterium]|nr:phage tail protein [Steroidobacteraceae bacterium]